MYTVLFMRLTSLEGREVAGSLMVLFKHFGLFWTDISEFGAAIIIYKHNKSKLKFLVFYEKPIPNEIWRGNYICNDVCSMLV